MVQIMKITDLTCEACTKLTTKRIVSISGVTSVSVELESGLATIAADHQLDVGEVNGALEGSSYRAEVYHGDIA